MGKQKKKQKGHREKSCSKAAKAQKKEKMKRMRGDRVTEVSPQNLRRGRKKLKIYTRVGGPEKSSEKKRGQMGV